MIRKLKKSFKKPKTIILVILLFILALCTWFYVSLKPPKQDWRYFYLNMITGIIGIIIVVYVIEGIIDSYRKKEEEKWTKVAFQQLKTPLSNHLTVIFHMFKASISTPPSKNYDNIFDFFKDNLPYLKQLDFLKPAPIFPTTDWSHYLFNEFSQFKEILIRAIFKYALFLKPETVELMEKIIDSHLMHFIIQSPSIISFYKRKGSATKINLLYDFLDFVEEYLSLIKKLVEKCERVYKAKKLEIHKDQWRNDVSPKWGSGRI